MRFIGEGKSFPKLLQEWKDNNDPRCHHEFVTKNSVSLGGHDYSYSGCKYCDYEKPN